MGKKVALTFAVFMAMMMFIPTYAVAIVDVASGLFAQVSTPLSDSQPSTPPTLRKAPCPSGPGLSRWQRLGFG